MRRRYDMFDPAPAARDARKLRETETKITNLAAVLTIRQGLVDRAGLKRMISKAENEACRLRKRLGGVTL